MKLYFLYSPWASLTKKLCKQKSDWINSIPLQTLASLRLWHSSQALSMPFLSCGRNMHYHSHFVHFALVIFRSTPSEFWTSIGLFRENVYLNRIENQSLLESAILIKNFIYFWVVKRQLLSKYVFYAWPYSGTLCNWYVGKKYILSVLCALLQL